jgi:hypothetical protein
MGSLFRLGPAPAAAPSLPSTGKLVKTRNSGAHETATGQSACLDNDDNENGPG